MYNPYDNSSNNNHNTNDDRTGKENSAGYGTAETPSYTTQASQNTPQGQHIGGMGVPVGSPYTRQDGTCLLYTSEKRRHRAGDHHGIP